MSLWMVCSLGKSRTCPRPVNPALRPRAARLCLPCNIVHSASKSIILSQYPFQQTLFKRSKMGEPAKGQKQSEYSFVHPYPQKSSVLGWAPLSLLLLLICAFLAGITLAICSLDMTWLEVSCASGPVKIRWACLNILPTTKVLTSLQKTGTGCDEA